MKWLMLVTVVWGEMRAELLSMTVGVASQSLLIVMTKLKELVYGPPAGVVNDPETVTVQTPTSLGLDELRRK